MPSRLERLLFPGSSVSIAADGAVSLDSGQAAADFIERQTTTGAAATFTFPAIAGDLDWIIANNCAGCALGALTLVIGNSRVTIPPDMTAYVAYAGGNAVCRLLDPRALGSGAYTDLTTVSAAGAGVPTDGRDATDALQALFASGLSVMLQPTKTYLISGPLTMTAGQTLRGNGATIKRAAQVSTTTTTTITSGVTAALTVADASGFRVGQTIGIKNGSTFDTSPRTISSIVGNVVTTSTTWAVSVSGTTTVFTAFYSLTTAANCRVTDVQFDGNKASWSINRWELTREVMIQGASVRVEGCLLNNAPGEGIYVNGDYARVRENAVTNGNGNGVHLSGCAHPVVVSNRIYNGNLDTTIGHADGLITWSNSITDATLSGNILDTTPLSGFASIDTADDSDITITGNTIRSCSTSPFSMNHADTGAADVIFADNRCYSCGPVLIKDTVSAEAAPASRVFILGNYFKDTLLVIQRSQDVLVEGNILDNLASTTSVLLLINNSQWVTIRGNDLIGGGYGVYIDQPGGSIVTKSIMVEGNNFRMQRTSGVREAVASLTNIVIANNAISNDGTADAANYDGILARDGCHVSGNSIEITAGHAGIYANSGAIVEHNVVRKGAATSSIRADGGTTGVIIRDNLVTTAVSDVGDGLHTSGNITIA